jgi:hypothetical protein
MGNVAGPGRPGEIDLRGEKGMFNGIKRLLLILGIVVSLVSYFWTFSIVPVLAAAPEVTVSITPKSIAQKVGMEFSVDVMVTTVTDLNTFNFDITYDPSVIRVTGTEGGTGVLAGQINDTSVSPVVVKSIPIGWSFAPPGTQGKISITGNLKAGPGNGADGTGSLARINFVVVGAYGENSFINPQNVVMKQTGVTYLTINRV